MKEGTRCASSVDMGDRTSSCASARRGASHRKTRRVEGYCSAAGQATREGRGNARSPLHVSKSVEPPPATQMTPTTIRLKSKTRHSEGMNMYLPRVRTHQTPNS
jgi:hypothetical protein